MTAGDWFRTCQECGNRQKARAPVGEMTDAYRSAKCKKCKSESLDYGKYKSEEEK